MSPDPINRERSGSTASLSDSVTEPLERVTALAKEVLQVNKQVVETGRVRVSVTTETTEEIIRQTLRTRRAEIERVTLGHEVREIPQTREENGVLIVPVVEEILVIEKRLVLKEEIRLRFVDGEDTVEQTVGRRVQSALVERLPPSETAIAPASGTVVINGDNEDITP